MTPNDKLIIAPDLYGFVDRKFNYITGHYKYNYRPFGYPIALSEVWSWKTENPYQRHFKDIEKFDNTDGYLYEEQFTGTKLVSNSGLRVGKAIYTTGFPFDSVIMQGMGYHQGYYPVQRSCMSLDSFLKIIGSIDAYQIYLRSFLEESKNNLVELLLSLGYYENFEKQQIARQKEADALELMKSYRGQND